MKKKFFRLSATGLLFFLQGLWRLAGAFLTWWSAAKEGKEKERRNGLNYLYTG